MQNHNRKIQNIGGPSASIKGHTAVVMKSDISGGITIQHVLNGELKPARRLLANTNSLASYVASHGAIQGNELLSSVLSDLGVAGFSGGIRNYGN